MLRFLPQSTAGEVIWLFSLGCDWVLWHKGTPHPLGQTLKPTKSCCSEHKSLKNSTMPQISKGNLYLIFTIFILSVDNGKMVLIKLKALNVPQSDH